MKSTKTLFLAAIAVCGLMACGSVRAQDSTSTNNMAGAPGSGTNAMPRGLHMHGPNMDRMAAALHLTDEQKTQVEPIMNNEYQKIRSIIQDQSLSRDEKRSQIMDLRKSTAEQLKTILTPEQYEQYSAAQTHMRRMAPPQTGATTNAPSGQQ